METYNLTIRQHQVRKMEKEDIPAVKNLIDNSTNRSFYFFFGLLVFESEKTQVRFILMYDVVQKINMLQSIRNMFICMINMLQIDCLRRTLYDRKVKKGLSLLFKVQAR